MDNLASKYKELFYRFSSHSKFEKMVNAVRERFEVGVDDTDETLRKKFKQKKFNGWEDAIYDIVFAIIPAYMEPEGDFIYSVTESYVLGGQKAVDDLLSKDVGFTYGVRVYPNLSAEHLSRFGERYKKGVFVYISPHVSKSSLISVINKKWANIKNELLKKNQNNNNLKKLLGLRSHTKKERDNLVFELYSKSRKDLGLKKGDFKEIKVASLLRERFGIEIQPENVKIISLRKRKLREGNI